MKVIIKKKSGAKHKITYIREGLEDFWIEADDFLVIHDLCHYAIENTLQYKNAFWGLVATGINPGVFENKETRDALQLSNEAWYAEHLANLLLIEIIQGKFNDMNQVLNESITRFNPTIPGIHYSDKEMVEIRNVVEKMFNSWKVLETGERLIFEFNI
jgi:hypothetical protein